MNHSESIGALAAALSKAQAAMKPAAKDAKNPHLNRSYADLASVWDAAREPLTTNGLAVMQAFLPAETGYVTVETLLAHSSGEWVSSVLTMPAESGPQRQGAQAYGSAITYARRYSLAAILGIAPAGDDDDGSAASARGDEDTSAARNGTQVPRGAGSLAAMREAMADPATAATILGLWQGEGSCPSCNAPQGKRHGSSCTLGQSAQAEGR